MKLDIPPELVEQIDAQRGPVSRKRFVCLVLEHALRCSPVKTIELTTSTCTRPETTIYYSFNTGDACACR